MLFLLLMMLVTPFIIGGVAAIGMHFYRSRQPLPLLLPRWVSTNCDSQVTVISDTADTAEPPGSGKTQAN